jgi:hypothetical protein
MLSLAILRRQESEVRIQESGETGMEHGEMQQAADSKQQRWTCRRGAEI